MTTSASPGREAAKLRKRRQRERQREQARIAAEAMAQRMEEQAEAMVPRASREGVLEGSQWIRGGRVAVVDGKPVHALPWADSEAITGRWKGLTGFQRNAAARFQQDWAEVASGTFGRAVNLMSSGSAGVGGHGGADRVVLGQVEVLRRLEAAMAHLGALTRVMCRVVVDCVPVTAFAGELSRERGEEIAPAVVFQMLVIGLNKLVRLYFPETVGRDAPAIRTFGPARDSYSMAQDE